MPAELKKKSATGAVDKPMSLVNHKGKEKQVAAEENSTMVRTKKRQATKDAGTVAGLNVQENSTMVLQPLFIVLTRRLLLVQGMCWFWISVVAFLMFLCTSKGVPLLVTLILVVRVLKTESVNVQVVQKFDSDNQSVQEFNTDDRLQTLRRSTKHPSHPEHELLWKTDNANYTCDGCKRQWFGPRYSCELCSFNLHEICMSSSLASPATPHHDLVENSTFEFLSRPRGDHCRKYDSCLDCYRRCEACAKPTKGFVYCQEGEARGITFHPFCFHLPSKLIAEEIEYELCTNLSKKCLVCDKRQLEGTVTGNTGWAYVSKCKENYNIHVFCAMKMSLDIGKDGNLVLQVQNNKKLLSKKHGKEIRKKVISFFKILVSLLLGDPISLTVTVVDALLN